MSNLKFSLFPFDVINIRKMAVRKNRRWLPLVVRELCGKYVLASKKRKLRHCKKEQAV
jgi:hypothetical protein